MIALVRYVKIISFLLFSVFPMILARVSFSIAATSLSHYEATFEIIPNHNGEFRDVKTELKVVYRIAGELKTGGMKFIEAPSLDGVQVTDGEGKPLRFKVSRSGKRYSRINWYFPGISKGEQVVIIHFNLPGAIKIVGEKNYFWAYWVGSWIIPVDRALYRLIFPEEYSYKSCSIYPAYEYKEKVVDGKKQIEVPIAPLKGESFTLAFSPSFIKWEKTERGSQILSSPSKEEIKRKKQKEEKIKEEELKEKLTSSTTTTSKAPLRREGEKQPVSAEAKRIYDSAQELFEQGRYKEALSNLRYFMDSCPKSVLADAVSFLIGECYFSLAKEGILRSYQPAIDAFQLALALYPESKGAPRGLFQLANSYREMKYHYEADANYQTLIEKYPNAECIRDAHFWMAENSFGNGEFEVARDQFEKFITRYPQSDHLKQAFFRIADCCAGLKDYGRAQKSYEEALGRWPKHSGLLPETLFNMGLTYLKNGDYSRSRSILFMVLNTFPDQDFNHIILTRIGDTYKMEGKVEEALKVYSQNTVLYPESNGALISEIKMADIGVDNPGFFKFDQYLDPLNVYQRIIERYPATDLAEEALYKQGSAFREQKKYQEAIDSLLTVLDEYPESALSKKCFCSIQETLCKLIDSYFSEEKYYLVLELYQKHKNPFLDEVKNTTAFFQMGESFRQGGLYDEALDMYGKAQRIYPRSYPEDELIIRMGEIYVLKKEYARAEKLFKRMIEKFPESKYRKIAFHNLADNCYEQEDYGEARLAYLSALKGERRIPRDIKGFFYLGRCYHAIGNVSSAIGAFRKAIQVAEHLGKDQVEQEFVIKSYFQLADCLYQNRKYKGAIEIYTQTVEQYPEDDRVQWALYRIAESYRKVGKEKAGIKSLKELASRGSREAFWEKVISEDIRNLEWEMKNRKHLVP